MNLLTIPDEPESSIFLDTLGSSLILPQILLPARITEASQTLIDNIFSTVSDFQNISGNICFSISDHLPQFCILTRENVVVLEMLSINRTGLNLTRLALLLTSTR